MALFTVLLGTCWLAMSTKKDSLSPGRGVRSRVPSVAKGPGPTRLAFPSVAPGLPVGPGPENPASGGTGALARRRGPAIRGVTSPLTIANAPQGPGHRHRHRGRTPRSRSSTPTTPRRRRTPTGEPPARAHRVGAALGDLRLEDELADVGTSSGSPPQRGHLAEERLRPMPTRGAEPDPRKEVANTADGAKQAGVGRWDPRIGITTTFPPSRRRPASPFLFGGFSRLFPRRRLPRARPPGARCL